MIPVANHLPLRFESKGNARSRIPARARALAIGVLEGLLIAAAIIAAATSL